MVWSFSRLRTYEECPYAFYLKYILEEKGESNFFAANGKVMHELFEELLNKKIILQDAPKSYMDKYETIYEETSISTMNKIFDKCLDYLCNVDELSNKYEILGVELKIEFEYKGYKFLGFVDCVLKDKENGKVILVDHKSSDHFLKKDGTPLKTKENDFFAYKKQMYLYCKGLKEQLGIQIDIICWHHFKDDGQLTVILFNEEEMEETLNWAVNLIEEIKKDTIFDAVVTYLRCNKLCDFRNECEYKNDI